MVIVLDNAIKYSKPGTEIKISLARSKKIAKIIVSDYGKGIEENQLPHVFERFYRGDSARSNATPGYGLGLSIAKELMVSQRGEIIVDSTKNVGTKVCLTVPLSA